MHAIPLVLTALVTVAAPDAVTPRATARAYFEAIIRGDADAALALVAEPTEEDRLVVRAAAASEHGLRRVEELAVSRFGERGELGIAARHRRLVAANDKAPLEVSGDRAVLRPSGERPVRLRRVGGTWKIESPADRLTSGERKALDRALKRTEEATKDLGERIRSGALKSAKDARDALRKALGRDEEGVPL
jgi:hypothetical protein